MGCIFRKLSCRQQFRRKLYTLNNLLIPGAAANIIPNSLSYLVFRRIRHLIKQSLRRNNHTRRAKPALNRSGLGERPYVSLPFPFRKPLDRYDTLSFQSICPLHASFYGIPVDQNHARTASALTATVFYRSKPQLVAQKCKQSHIVCTFIGLVVYKKCCHRLRLPWLLLYYVYINFLRLFIY